MKSDSRIQLIFNGNPNNIGASMATKVMKKNEFTLDYISSRAETLLNSNENFILSSDFNLNVKISHVNTNNGGSASKFKMYDTYNEALKKKRSVLTSYRGHNSSDRLCFARSLILVMAYIRFKKS